MSKPYVHAVRSAQLFGGRPEDYLPVHDFLDSSKAAFPDNRHRALTHNTWFLTTVLDRVFGPALTNSDGDTVPTRAVGEQHVIEDFGGQFIPSAQDFLQSMDARPWMDGRGVPPSFSRTESTPPVQTIPLYDSE